VTRAREDPAAFYTAGYSLADHDESMRMGRWRALGARSKAAHARTLCARAGLRPATVVEIGCGDGSLLLELAAAWPAATFDGFELSPPAIEIARGRGIPRSGRLEAYDGSRVPAHDGAYDLAVLSHVLEHVPDPAPLLAEAARVARHVLVEVPLEANRSAARPAKQAEAARIGHLHAFDRAAVRALVAGAGLDIVAELSDPLPRAHHAFFAETAAARLRAAAKWAVRAGVWRVAPKSGERWFTVHYAVLTRRKLERGIREPPGTRRY
jgi:SAM-dependent methyltransferase